MSKKAKLNEEPSISNVKADKATEGFYLTVNNECWPPNTIVYKSYSGEITAFGYGYLTPDQNHAMKELYLRRIPDNIEIIVQN